MITIDTLSDLLNAFVDKMNKVLDASEIKHPPTIGSMYEGLSKEVLQSALFSKEIDLRVITNSFIKGCDTEFDVMIVEGEGEEIPYTKGDLYPANQVLVVVQVKKSLYGKDLKDSFANLQFVADQYKDVDPEPWMDRMFADSFRCICGKSLEAYMKNELNMYEDAVSQSLRKESYLPLRIVWGYNGYASENRLRESFVKFLNENLSTNEVIFDGFGPNNFPNLIICDDYTILKMDAMPFMSSLDKDGWWTFYATSHYNKMRFILESLWTRLSYKYSLSHEIFGDDLQKEPATEFLKLRCKRQESVVGWELEYLQTTDEQMKNHDKIEEWAPVEIDESQFAVLNVLGQKGVVNWEENKSLHDYVYENGYLSIEEFVHKICETRLVCCEGKFLKLLTDNCVCVCCDGKWYAADNRDNRLQNWTMKHGPKN